MRKNEQVEAQVNEVVKRVEALCEKAYRSGYLKGFEAGVTTAASATIEPSEVLYNKPTDA